MKNILENKFWSAAKSFAAVAVLGISVATAQGVFISEYAEGSSNNKYMEIYNGTGADVDLSDYWVYQNSNGGAFDQYTDQLDGTLASGDVYVLAHSSSSEGILAEADLTGSGVCYFNGDDYRALYKIVGTEVTLIDIIGVPDVDPGSGWDVAGVTNGTKDNTLVRKSSVTTGNVDWAASAGTDTESSEWIVADRPEADYTPPTLGSHTMGAPSIVGTWKLAPLAGALGVGPSPGDYSWWSSDEAAVTDRACLFDDEYVFNADGSFQNVQGSETWLETWQTDVTAEGCGAPVAPHDGSNPATFSFDAAAGTITVSGSGAYLGLAKVHNGGEDGAPVDDMITYNYSLAEDGNSMDITIQGFNSGVPEATWIFKMVNSQWEPTYEDINITFNLDMSGAESINSEGISIAGGNLFGVPGENQMTDEDGDNIYTTTITVPANSGSDYTFINGVSDWGQKENIAGQECAVDPYNDRTIEWGTEDIVVNACFGICGDGICADLTPPTTVLVHFNVYVPGGPETVWATGSFEGWSGYGVAMTDPDGNGIYNGTAELSENFGDVEYKYTYGGWDVETGATTGDWCDWNPDDSWNNFGFSVEEHDVYLPIFIWGGGCGQWYSDMAGRPWMIANEPGAIAVGPSMGSGEWWSNDEASLTDRACYFDDRYYFTWNGEFHNDFRGDTWLETWQEGVDADGCGTPVAPHDNSNPASYSFDAEAGTITLHGAGAFLGLPKAFNGGELSNGGTVPESVTYIVDHFDEDSAMVYIDVSENETGGSWWTYTMVREPAPTMVTFWLDAYDVPCDGSPYLAGSFNGWNATDIEMTYDEEWDEYYADVYLMPGYYEYKFTCFDWSASENIPAECSDPNDDGYSNRYVEVPELDVEDWYEVDVVGWGECPDPEPCELVEDCGNLSLVFIMEEPFIQQITDTLLYYMDISADEAYSYIAGGNVNMEVHNFYNSEVGLNTFSAEFIPEVSSPEDSVFIYLAEIPGGFPDSVFSYYWVASTVGGFLGEYFEGECTDYNEAWNMETRYWDPADWEEELGMLAMGDEDIDPSDIWNFDNWNSCDYYFTDDPGDWTYIGNFEGHDYYAVDNGLNWYEANDAAQNAGGYLATITSLYEEEFIRYSLEYYGMTNAYWFGLHDYNADGTGWGWVTGELLDYTKWADDEPNMPGEENCGEYMSWDGYWNDFYCDVEMPFIVEIGDYQPPPEPTITSYTYSVQTLDSYNNGDYATTVLPSVDVNDGLHTIAYFDTVGIEGPYAGLFTLFFDSNFNGQLDSTDFNMLSWSDFGNDDNVILLVDNGPDDMNPEVGVYETIIHHDSDEGGFIRVQGADYFMTAISPDYTVSGYTTVSPVSGSTNRVTGTGTMPDPDTGELVGVPNMWVSMWEWYYGDLVGMGITGPDGSYDIGVDINDYTEVWITVDENYNMTNRYFGVFENGGWGGYGGTWIQATLGLNGYVQDFDVIKLNTWVYGQVTAPDGSPAAGVGVNIEWTYAGDYYGYYNSSLWSYTETNDYGYYSFWGMNGESVNISIWSDYDDYYEEVNIFSEEYDEYLDGYYFNHDIMLMDPPDLPQTELLANNSFEDYYNDYYSWNNYANNWLQWPTSHNTHIEHTGAGVGWDGAEFSAYDGDHSLKMWGQYNGGDNSTSYYQGFNSTAIQGGAVIHASAVMMSHPEDWIGGGSGLNNGQVFVSYFDYDWNFLGTDFSEPVDSSDAAGEWHHREVEGVVPDGAFYVNIGVQYNQVIGSDGGEGHGAIFYDNVYAYTSASNVPTVQIYGMTEQDEIDEYGEHIGSAPLPNAPVYVWNENYFIEVMSDDYGWWFAEVPVNQNYYVTGGDIEGFYESSFEEVFACDGYYYYDYDEYCYYDYYYGYEYCYDDYYDYCDNQANIHFTNNDVMWFDVQGQVSDASGNPMYNAQVVFHTADSDDYRRYFSYTDYMGYFQENLPYGVYNVSVGMTGFMVSWNNGVEVTQHGVFLEISLEPAEFTGAVEGVVVLHGNTQLDGQIHLNFWNDEYDAMGTTNDNGFFNIPLVDGVYNVFADAPGYGGFYQQDAFEISGNTVVYHIDLYEHGYAGAPQIVDLHDIPNDQGRQMRSVWSPGIPGNWEYFTQYSIWRKVNGAPVELWDYIETVPWHGMDEPYAAVVPTLGDSSVHGIYESTFMVTAHTEDIDVWFDSQPISGYSIDNLHPGTPMSLVYTHDPGAVSLSWSGPEDEDFSYHNIYRQDIASSDPAVVFTTVDSFYVDLDVTDAGAYEYWVTAVDLSGLESEASNSVSAVLSADENLGLPTEFALRQNYPNPFNPSTQIQYALPEETRVVISIYDLMGRKIRTLVNDVQDAGYRSVMWNSTNEMGRLVSAGVYIYSIQAGDFVQNRKMVLMK